MGFLTPKDSPVETLNWAADNSRPEKPDDAPNLPRLVAMSATESATMALEQVESFRYSGAPRDVVGNKGPGGGVPRYHALLKISIYFQAFLFVTPLHVRESQRLGISSYLSPARKISPVPSFQLPSYSNLSLSD